MLSECFIICHLARVVLYILKTMYQAVYLLEDSLDVRFFKKNF